MSQSNPRNMSVPANGLIDFLQNHTPDTICEACGSDDWSVLTVEATSTAAELHIPFGNTPSPTSIPCLVLYCSHCGNMRFHASRVVSKWIKSNQDHPKAEPGEGADE